MLSEHLDILDHKLVTASNLLHNKDVFFYFHLQLPIPKYRCFILAVLQFAFVLCSICISQTLDEVFLWQCDPYFDNSGCSHPGCEPAYPTPKCEKKCKKQNLRWRDSKHFSVNAYRISSEPYSIMAEVFKNGPVEVSFTVYEVKEEI